MTMKNTIEAKATLHAVLARLEGEPKTSKEWRIIQAQLDEVRAYANKCAEHRERFEAGFGGGPP